MLKRLFLLLTLLLARANIATAYDFMIDGLCYNKNSDGQSVTVTYQNVSSPRYSALSGALTIPSTVTYAGTTYSVTSIGEWAFYDCIGLTSVTIPNSVTKIIYGAFKGCSGLTSVTIPNSVFSIGTYAFSGCSSLTSVAMPNSVIKIGESAFSSCYSLTSVTIPNSVTLIGTSAFSQCRGLTSVTIPNSVTKIGNGAFSGCSSLTSVTIPNSVTTIGEFAFSSCNRLTSVHINDIAKWCQIGFGSDDSNPLYYAHHLYLDNTEITNLEIPNSVSAIGEFAFYGCSGLTSVSIPKSVTSIGEFAFCECSGLTSVAIPNTVTKIGNGAFFDCSGLTSVHINDIAKWCQLSFESSYSNPLYYAHHLYFDGKEITNLEIPNSVTSIGEFAFYGYSGLTSVTIPNSVLTIASSAFYNCSGLTSVTIPNSVTQIGNGAFSGCSSLTSVTIPNSVISIGESAFAGCRGLTSVTIPNSVFSIAPCTFYNCSGLTSVTIPNSVSSIRYYAFYNCSALTSVTIPNSVSQIDDRVFSGCSGLSSVTWNAKNCQDFSSSDYTPFKGLTNIKTFEFGNEVEKIPAYLCYGLSGLTSVTISNSVTLIGEWAFADCSSLTSLALPNSVTLICYYAFSGCSGLTSVTIPTSVTSIDENAFSGCYCLTSVTWNAKNCQNFTSSDYTPFKGLTNIKTFEFGNEVEKIPANICYGLSGLTSVTISNSVTKIGNYAFSGCSRLRSIYSYVNPTEVTLGSSVFYGVDKQKCVLHYPYHFDEAYRTMSQWKDFLNISYINVIPVTGITLNKSEVSIYYHAQEQLTATIHPENADQKNLRWTSDNEVIAMVDANGNVTALAIGTATITASATDDSGVSAACRVTVTGTSDFGLSDSELQLFMDENYRIDATFTPSDLVWKTLNWSSSDTNVATVSSDGTITAKGTGSATITATTTDGTNLSRSCQVTVLPKSYLTTGVLEHLRGDAEAVVALPVCLDNTTEVTQLQFDFTLPEGVSIVGEYNSATGITYYDNCIQLDNERKTRSHYATINHLGGSTYRVLITSAQGNIALKGNHGTVANLMLHLARYHEAGDHYITFSNIVMSGTDVTGRHTASDYNSLVRFHYKLGDANADVDVDVADYQATARYILRLYTPHFYADAANINNDENINVSDLQGIVNIMAGIDPATIKREPKKPTEARLSLVPMMTADGRIAVKLQGTATVSAMQMDLTLPQCAKLVGATTTSGGHQVDYAAQADGTYRLVIGSPSGAVIELDDEAFLLLTIDGARCGTALLHEAIAVERDLTTHLMDNIMVDLTQTAIDNPTEESTKIYIDNNRLVIESPTDGTAQLVRVNGITTPLTVNTGRTVFDLNTGIYIVRLGSIVAKIQIR